MLLEVLVISFFTGCQCLTCLDDDGKKVDWFIIYKLPKLEKYQHSKAVAQGEGYVYLNSNKKNTQNWTLSEHDITDKSSSLGRTLNSVLFKKNSKTSILMYNDQPPDSQSTAAGHSKGVLAFDLKSGIWLIHSVPRFPIVGDYEYPSNALENAQTILCISLPFQSVNDIGHHLLYIRPKIYYKESSDAVNKLEMPVQTLFKKSPKFINRKPFAREADITSIDKTPFKLFAKSGRWGNEFYSELVAPGLKSSLIVETWRRGSGTVLPPTCQTEYTVQDVQTMNITAGDKSFFFSYTEDHSKWAISADAGNWVCIGDINRMLSQAKRGGGAACFQSTPVSKAFTLSVKDTDGCKPSKRSHGLFKRVSAYRNILFSFFLPVV